MLPALPLPPPPPPVTSTTLTTRVVVFSPPFAVIEGSLRLLLLWSPCRPLGTSDAKAFGDTWVLNLRRYKSTFCPRHFAPLPLYYVSLTIRWTRPKRKKKKRSSHQGVGPPPPPTTTATSLLLLLLLLLLCILLLFVFLFLAWTSLRVSLYIAINAARSTVQQILIALYISSTKFLLLLLQQQQQLNDNWINVNCLIFLTLIQ